MLAHARFAVAARNATISGGGGGGAKHTQERWQNIVAKKKHFWGFATTPSLFSTYNSFSGGEPFQRKKNMYKGSAWLPAYAGTHASGRAGQHFELFDSIFVVE